MSVHLHVDATTAMYSHRKRFDGTFCRVSRRLNSMPTPKESKTQMTALAEKQLTAVSCHGIGN